MLEMWLLVHQALVFELRTLNEHSQSQVTYSRQMPLLCLVAVLQ